jgi:signal recognition particle subunit SRP54
MRTATFTLDDFLEQMQQIKKMGPLSQILGMLPGVDAKAFKGVELDDKQFARTVAIIQSMTKKERSNPGILNAGRRQRIAKGSGTTVTDVNRLLKQFEEMKKMMKRFTGGNAKKMMKGMGGFRRPF